MDAKKFDACKDKVRQSVIAEIDNLLTKEWDRLMASIGAVCDMDEAFPLAIAVVLTPHEGGIVHAAGLKYKCSREASGEPGFVRYDGTEQVQGELFGNVDELQDEVEALANQDGWEDFEEYLNEARSLIEEKNLATESTLMTGLLINMTLADKTLQLLEAHGFLTPRDGDDPRGIASLKQASEDEQNGGQEPDAKEVQTEKHAPVTDDPILNVLIEKGYPDKEAFLAQAKETVIETRRATVSIIQRRLQVSFKIALWAIEALQELGVVTAADREGKREVITAAESNADAEEIANG